jgi:hypothetical protein
VRTTLARAALSLCLLAGCGADTSDLPSRNAGSKLSAGTGALGSSNANAPGVLLTPSSAAQVGVATGANGCVPGHYVGSFDGKYNSAAWGNGSVPLQIEAVASMGKPGLEFWLEQSSQDCAGAEFCPDFTVKGGKIRGFANPFSDGRSSGDGSSSGMGFAIAVRFEIDFGGDLDCSTGQFRGLLQNGCYDVATILFRFEGTAPATYDRMSSSFTNGQWTVKELALPDSLLPPDPNIGGAGAWKATLAQDNATPVDSQTGLCHM